MKERMKKKEEEEQQVEEEKEEREKEELIKMFSKQFGLKENKKVLGIRKKEEEEEVKTQAKKEEEGEEEERTTIKEMENFIQNGKIKKAIRVCEGFLKTNKERRLSPSFHMLAG